MISPPHPGENFGRKQGGGTYATTGDLNPNFDKKWQKPYCFPYFVGTSSKYMAVTGDLFPNFAKKLI